MEIVNCNRVFFFLKVNFEEDSRAKYLELLGYRKDDLRNKVSVAESCACVKYFVDGFICQVQPCIINVFICVWALVRAISDICRLFQHNELFHTTLFSVCFPAGSTCQCLNFPKSL